MTNNNLLDRSLTDFWSKKREQILIYSLLSRVRNADSEFRFDCYAFMSFANDKSLALLCPKFAKKLKA